MSPEMQMQIAGWRSRIADGTITVEEMKAAIAALRQDRISAAYVSESSRARKAPKPALSADSLLGELDDM